MQTGSNVLCSPLAGQAHASDRHSCIQSPIDGCDPVRPLQLSRESTMIDLYLKLTTHLTVGRQQPADTGHGDE